MTPEPASLMSAQDLSRRCAGLLVDLDGTLVDSTVPVTRTWTAFAHRHGLLAEEVCRFAQGRPSGETIRLLVPDAASEEADRVERQEVQDTRGVRALPGAAELLEDGRPLAIVTSCSRALAVARLRAAGLPVPEAMITADDVTRGKPDPEAFLLGASRLGLPPEICLALEDSPNGILAAKAAGAMVLAVSTTHDPGLLGQADVVVENLLALVD